MHLAIGSYSSAFLGGPNIFDCTVRQRMAVEALVAEGANALSFVEILALFFPENPDQEVAVKEVKFSKSIQKL